VKPIQSKPARPTRVLCLGDALVDLVCERWVDDLGEATSFVPHFGGAVANLAAVAARAGAPVTLAGGAGADVWGEWLRARLVREGVDASMFTLSPETRTQLALVTVNRRGEPSYTVYGEPRETLSTVLRSGVPDAVAGSAALLISSNTLVGQRERELTMRARETALELDRPVIFDADLRLHRWRSRADAAASANACVPRALLVRATAAEAALMTGEEDPEAAASSLVKAGARLVVLTLGREGAILRGELRASASGSSARVLSTVGAGGALTGILVARLAESRFYPPAVAAALRDAVAAAARACERWGALD
jgi:sugar/nucleoside kinase (ribokinase family)